MDCVISFGLIIKCKIKNALASGNDETLRDVKTISPVQVRETCSYKRLNCHSASCEVSL